MKMKQKTEAFISSCYFSVSCIGQASFPYPSISIKKKIPNIQCSSSLKNYTKQITNY